MKKNLWKAAVVIAVIIIAAVILVPKFVGQETATTTKKDGQTTGKTAENSQTKIDKALKSGRATMVLFGSAT